MAGGKTFIDGDEKFDLNIASGDVSTSQIEASAVTNAKLAATGLDISKLTVGTLSLDRIPDALTGKDADTLDGVNSNGFIRSLTAIDFKNGTPSGTCIHPERAIDDNSITSAILELIGEYVEIDFGGWFFITQYKYQGYGPCNNDGSFKIQHWDGLNWVDNTTGIVTVGAAGSGYTLLTTSVVTNKIRMVATALDTAQGKNIIAELEMLA